MDVAALGTELEVPLLDARVRMKIPAGTQPGSVFRVRGKGLPAAGGGRGDAHVRVQVEVPSLCGDEARATLSRLGDVLGADAYPHRRAFQEMMTAMQRREE
jgi:molecular chaperone DnaJ